MRSEFGKTRIMPNSQRVAEAGKGVAGVDVKTRSVVMPNWRAKTLISSGREAGRSRGRQAVPSRVRGCGRGDAAGRGVRKNDGNRPLFGRGEILRFDGHL